MQTDKPRYAINLKDERIVYRSKATDEMRALYRWIPNDVAKAIMEGKLEAKKVVNVITKKMFSDENFDHSEYEAELRKLNVVFKEEEVPEPEEVVDTTRLKPRSRLEAAGSPGKPRSHPSNLPQTTAMATNRLQPKRLHLPRKTSTSRGTAWQTLLRQRGKRQGTRLSRNLRTILSIGFRGATAK